MTRDFNRRIPDTQLILRGTGRVLCTYYLHRATATGTMNNLWRPKLSLTPPGIVRSIQDRLLTPRSIELFPSLFAKSKWWKRGGDLVFDAIKKWREWRRGKKGSFDVIKKWWEKKGVRGEKGKRRRKYYIYNRGIATCWLHRCHIFTTSSFTFFFFSFLFYTTPYFPGTAWRMCVHSATK